MDAAPGQHGDQVAIAQSVCDAPTNAELNRFVLNPAATVNGVAVDDEWKRIRHGRV
jgi:hypothetical protein